MNNMNYQRLTKNVKVLVTKNRAAHFIKNLQQKDKKKFSLLQTTFHNFIIRWRQRYIKRLQKFIVNEICKKNLKKKMHHNILKINLYANKLKIMRKWIVIMKN